MWLSFVSDFSLHETLIPVFGRVGKQNYLCFLLLFGWLRAIFELFEIAAAAYQSEKLWALCPSVLPATAPSFRGHLVKACGEYRSDQQRHIRRGMINLSAKRVGICQRFPYKRGNWSNQYYLRLEISNFRLWTIARGGAIYQIEKSTI